MFGIYHSAAGGIGFAHQEGTPGDRPIQIPAMISWPAIMPNMTVKCPMLPKKKWRNALQIMNGGDSVARRLKRCI